MRALIVDDSRFIRQYLAELLCVLGIESEQSVDGCAAWERLRQDGEKAAFDFALVDVNMPRMGGMELVRKLRAEPGHGHLKLMMVTTEADMVYVSAALELGVDEFLMKPFSPECFKEKLQMLGLVGS